MGFNEDTTTPTKGFAMASYSTFLLRTLRMLETDRLAVAEHMTFHDPDDKWMTLGDRIDQELRWTQDELAKEIQAGNYP